MKDEYLDNLFNLLPRNNFNSIKDKTVYVKTKS